MSPAKELLDAATPLPWEWYGEAVPWDYESDADAALIVYAVNTLPAYEAGVEALDRLVDEWFDGTGGLHGPEIPARFEEAREALRRLQEQTQ